MATVTPTNTPQYETRVSVFWPRFKRRAIVLTVLMQLTLLGIIISALYFNLGDVVLEPIFVLVFIAIAAAIIAGNLLLVSLLLDPFRDLLAAMTKVSGEPNALAAPNPNAHHYERSGFKPVLQQVYNMAASTTAKQKTSPDESAVNPLYLDHTPNGIIFLDKDRRVVYANQAAPVTETTDATKKLQLLFEGESTLDNWLDSVDDSIHATHTWNRIPTMLVGQEGRRVFDISASYEKGSPVETVLVCFERTDVYEPQDDDLDFISFAAHELRGPITVIRGYLSTLEDEFGDRINEDIRDLIHRIDVSASRLSGYVNNILNASKYDRRHLKVNLQEYALADIYDLIRDDMELRARSQGRLLSVEIPRDLPTVAADRASVSEVMSNFIDNAIKYSREGGVVNVTVHHDERFVTVDVQDFGVGIPSNLLGNLFQKFYRSHRSRETVNGTGIGLYISKAMIESHGGNVGVKSREGKGSTFSFSLPIFATVADKLNKEDNSNESLIVTRDGWIRNHSMFKG